MRFLTSQEIIEINKKVIFDHGGLHGVRDINLLESAIANPQNLFCYKNSNIYELASSYAISIIKNHPFVDGNKRTGFKTMDLFLRFNGTKLKFQINETIGIFVKIAINEISIEELSKWLSDLGAF